MANYVSGKGGLARLLRRNLGYRRLTTATRIRDDDIIVNCGENLQRQDLRNIVNGNLIFNKFRQIRTMIEAGIECPESVQGAPDNLTDWIVKPYQSQGGRGIRRATEGDTPDTHYYQRYIDKRREFRGHVALWLPNGERCFSIQEKKLPEGTNHRDVLCWNHDFGSFFHRSTTPNNRAEKRARFPLFARIEDICIKSCEAIGHDFGAVDLLMDNNRKLWVIEVNTRPGIDTEASWNIYIDVFRALTPGMIRPAQQQARQEQAEEGRRAEEERRTHAQTGEARQVEARARIERREARELLTTRAIRLVARLQNNEDDMLLEDIQRLNNVIGAYVAPER